MHPEEVFEIGKLVVDGFESLIKIECVIDCLFDEPAILPDNDMVEPFLVDCFGLYQGLIMPKGQSVHLTYEPRITGKLALQL